jgi:hypothetical protein
MAKFSLSAGAAHFRGEAASFPPRSHKADPAAADGRPSEPSLHRRSTMPESSPRGVKFYSGVRGRPGACEYPRQRCSGIPNGPIYRRPPSPCGSQRYQIVRPPRCFHNVRRDSWASTKRSADLKTPSAAGRWPAVAAPSPRAARYRVTADTGAGPQNRCEKVFGSALLRNCQPSRAKRRSACPLARMPPRRLDPRYPRRSSVSPGEGAPPRSHAHSTPPANSPATAPQPPAARIIRVSFHHTAPSGLAAAVRNSASDSVTPRRTS